MMSHISPYMNQVQVSANPCSSVKITIPLSTMAVPSQCTQQNILSFMIILYCIKLVTCEQKGSKNSPNLSCWNTLLTYFFQNIWTLPYFNNLPIFVTVYFILTGWDMTTHLNIILLAFIYG
jgi:hypothetical protein